MTSYPTSIEGGITYTPEPFPKEKPVTQHYVVTWRISGGQLRGVKSPPLWRGVAMGPAMFRTFRRAVERDMATWPPI